MGTPTLDTDQQIRVTPGVNGFTFSQVSGTPFSVSLGQIADYDIGYQFVIDPAPVLEGAELGLDPPSGNVTITQSYCNDSAFLTATTCTNGIPVQTLAVFNRLDPSKSKLDATITFHPPANFFGNVDTNILLDGTLAPASFDQLVGSATVVGSPSPEPASFLLAFGGIVTLGVLRRRKL